MAPEKQPDHVEAALLAKIAAWTAALESYRAAKAVEGGSTDLPVGVGRPMDLPVGVFRDKGVKEAIPILLEAGRRKQTNKEIAQGLKDGGIATMSANFEATVGTALLRLKDEGVVLRFPDGWDLAESYPDSLKNRLGKEAKPGKKRGKARSAPKAQKRKVEARTRRAAKRSDANVASIGLSDRIAGYLQTRGAEFIADQEIATQLRIDNLQVIRMTLGKMVKAEKVERNADGRVRLVRRVA